MLFNDFHSHNHSFADEETETLTGEITCPQSWLKPAGSGWGKRNAGLSGPIESNKNIKQATNMSHVCNFTLSSSHIIKKKQKIEKT